MVYRIRGEKHPTVGRFADLRRIMDVFCAETGTDKELCLQTVGWFALAASDRDSLWRTGRQWLEETTEVRLEGNLLSLAAYFDHQPLARRLLSEGCCPATNDILLLTPMECAAMAGNVEMLLLFQEHLPDAVVETSLIKYGRAYRSKVHVSAVFGAAASGDIEMVKLALYPPSRTDSDSTDILGQPYGLVDPESIAGRAIKWAIEGAGQNWDVVQYLGGAFAERSDEDLRSLEGYKLAKSLWAFLKSGNLEIIRKMVESDLGEWKKYLNHWLEDATRNTFDDIVDFLLDLGVDPSGDRKCQWNFIDIGRKECPIEMAARAGSLSLLKKLLARGARVDKGFIHCWHGAFIKALELEHMDMARFLLALRTPSRCWQKRLLREDAFMIVKNLHEMESVRKFLHDIWGKEPEDARQLVRKPSDLVVRSTDWHYDLGDTCIWKAP